MRIPETLDRARDRVREWTTRRLVLELLETKLGEIPDAGFDHCHVIVHPGYSRIHGVPTPDKYGLYPARLII